MGAAIITFDPFVDYIRAVYHFRWDEFKYDVWGRGSIEMGWSSYTGELTLILEAGQKNICFGSLLDHCRYIELSVAEKNHHLILLTTVHCAGKQLNYRWHYVKGILHEQYTGYNTDLFKVCDFVYWGMLHF